MTTAFLHKADTLMKTELRRFVKWHQLLPHLVLLVAELLKSIAEAKRHKEEERMQQSSHLNFLGSRDKHIPEHFQYLTMCLCERALKM